MAVVDTAAVSIAVVGTPEVAFMEAADIAVGAFTAAGAVTAEASMAEVVAMAADTVVEDNRQTLQS
jgi:hypothetical protein